MGRRYKEQLGLSSWVTYKNKLSIYIKTIYSFILSYNETCQSDYLQDQS